MLATYNDMYNATYNGNRAPLILGNHFNEWNNSAYANALTDFVLEQMRSAGHVLRAVPGPDRLDGRAGSRGAGSAAGAAGRGRLTHA